MRTRLYLTPTLLLLLSGMLALPVEASLPTAPIAQTADVDFVSADISLQGVDREIRVPIVDPDLSIKQFVGERPNRDSFTATLDREMTATETLTLSNTGGGTPDVDVNVSGSTRVPISAASAISSSSVSTSSDAQSKSSSKSKRPPYGKKGAQAPTVELQGAPPSNDMFPGTPVEVLPFDDTTDTFDATLEATEPEPLCAPIGATVWYHFTPSEDMTLLAHTFGSDFDTVLAAYQGNDLASLEEVACNDDVGDLQSRFVFSAVAGVKYYFQVGGFSGDTGSLAFHLERVVLAPPVNDDFPGQEIQTLPFDDASNTLAATVEIGEPEELSCAPIGATVWYHFTPPEDITLLAHTFGSDFDTVLAAYLGNDLASLQEVACNDDGPRGLLSQVVFSAVAGGKYYFQIGGFDGDFGSLAFHLQELGPVQGVELLSNDLFAVVSPDIILRVDNKTGTVSEVPTPEPASLGPDGLAASEEFLFFINGFGSNSIYKMTHGGEVIDIFDTPGGAIDGLAFSDGTLYAQDFDLNQIIAFDPATGEVLGAVTPEIVIVGGIAPGPEGTLYVTEDFTRVVQIDAATGLVVSQVIDSGPIFGLAFDGTFLVLGSPGGVHLVVDPANGEVIGEITGLPGVSALAVIPPGVVVGVCADQNDDGVVNIMDAIIDMQIIVELISPTRRQMVLSDVVRDGGIDVFDVIVLLQHIVGLTEIAECGPLGA